MIGIRKETKLIRRVFTIAVLVIFSLMFIPLTDTLAERSEPGFLGARYVEDGPEEFGAANIVTTVVVTYRGLDTLGEVTVLFAAAAGISLIFSSLGKSPVKSSRSSEILETGAVLLLPLITVFGIYIFINGHLSPGGGFQGGVIIASGILLALFAGITRELKHSVLTFLEGLSGAAYVAIGLLGLWLAGGFLDPRFLPAGEFGSMFSGGAIPIIYSLIGIKVGAEMSGVIDSIRSYS